MNKLPAFACQLVLALFLATHALDSQALPSDRNQPVKISAEDSQLDGNSGATVYIGNVRVSQGSTLITADRLVSIVEDGETVKLVATGSPVRFKEQPAPGKPFTLAHAKKLTLNIVTQNIELQGDAYLVQDGKEMRADKIVHDSKARLTTAGGSGRVEVVLQPKKSKENQ